MAYKLEIKQEAVRLRVTEGLSLKHIAEKLSIAKGTLSLWLRDFPLDEAEKHRRYREENRARNYKPYTKKIEDSKAFILTKKYGNPEESTLRKARISESAVIYRLSLIGCNTYSSIFDGDKFDLLVTTPTNNNIIKIQVRWAAMPKIYGSPLISLRKSSGRSTTIKYTVGDFDFIIGYVLQPDYCYVYAWNEIAGKGAKAVTADALERWDKLLS